MGSASFVPDIHTSPPASVLDHKLSSIQSINEQPMSVAAVGVHAVSLGRIDECDVSGFVEYSFPGTAGNDASGLSSVAIPHGMEPPLLCTAKFFIV